MKTQLGVLLDTLATAQGHKERVIKVPVDTIAPSNTPCSEAVLYQIEAALSRLDLGTYGLCKQCGAEIELERLEANPIETICGCCAKS